MKYVIVLGDGMADDLLNFQSVATFLYLVQLL